jgi:hypothetical protein
VYQSKNTPIEMKGLICMLIPFLGLLSSCLYDPDRNYSKIEDGEYKMKLRFEYARMHLDTIVYGYVHVKKGFVAELDSENRKPFRLGLYIPAKVNDAEGRASISTLDGRKYSIVLMDTYGDPITNH